MIRAAALACLLAGCTPQVSAQSAGASLELDNLLPGMPVSNLGPVGEPFSIRTQDGLTLAEYPRPFGQQMRVVYQGVDILGLSFHHDFQGPLPPRRPDGLVLGRSTVAEVRDMAGSDGFHFEAVSLSPNMAPNLWKVSYTTSEDANLIMTLSFNAAPMSFDTTQDYTSLADAPQDAVLGTVYFTNPLIVAGRSLPVDAAELPVPAPPGAIPFALPLAEAFAPFDLSQ